MTPSNFKDSLEEKLAIFDKEGAIELCNKLITFLYLSSEPFDSKIAEKILQLLRNKRMFKTMQSVCDAFIFTGRQSYRIYRQYAQSLIDSGNYSAALFILNNIRTETKNAPPENVEAKKEVMEAEGLIGRLYKQLYVNSTKINSFNSSFLKQALQAYFTVYTTNPAEYLWQGINAVALLYRAKEDGISLSGFPHYMQLAEEIFTIVKDKVDENLVQTWDYATAAEACVALNKTGDALKWISDYATNKGCDAFELASTIRQFEEVWKLDIRDEMGKRILTVLRDELLKREGGNVIVQASDVTILKRTQASYERNFGNNIFIDFKSYKNGYACCEAVARIGHVTEKGDGTGFLLKGSALHESFGNEWLLITNAHVISEDIYVRTTLLALHPDEAIIIFEALDRNTHFKAGSVVFYSPPLELDVTIIRFRQDELEGLNLLTKDVVPYEFASVLPIASGDPLADPRLYVIGHPKGGPLQFSMQDNLLLDCQDPRIHYRTPTEGGSSGSPVFNQSWELVGIHHAGKKNMQRLNGKEGFYEANEGIWMQAVRKAISAKFST